MEKVEADINAVEANIKAVEADIIVVMDKCVPKCMVTVETASKPMPSTMTFVPTVPESGWITVK